MGFISIGTLLLISGLISSAELVRFQRYASQMMHINQNSIDFSKKLLDAIQEQNTALLISITDTTGVYNRVFDAARVEFDQIYDQVIEYDQDNPVLSKIKEANQKYNTILIERGDSVTVEWFSQLYKTSYFDLTQSIKEYMVDAQNLIIHHTSVLEGNAYRSTMVGIIALVSGGILMLMFYFMINKFFISPVLHIKDELQKHLSHNLPYDVNIDTTDEIKDLNDKISQVVIKNNKQF